MASSQWEQPLESSDDTNAELGTDLFSAFSAVCFLLMIIAMASMGIPEVKRKDHEAVLAEKEEHEKTIGIMQSTIKGLRTQVGSLRSTAFSLYGKVTTGKKTIIGLKHINNSLQQKNDGLKQESDGYAKKITDTEKQARRTKVDFVLAIDGSWSMSPVSDELRSFFDVLLTVGSSILPQLRVSVVTYRRDPDIFPLTHIERTESGKKSKGQAAWDRYSCTPVHRFTSPDGLNKGKRMLVSRFGNIPGNIDIVQGIQAALNQFLPPSSDTRRILVIAGDMGAGEIQANTEELDATERRREKAIVRKVGEFARAEGSSVLALYTGERTTLPQLKYESRRFFKELAQAAGESGTFSEDTSDLTGMMLRKSLVKDTGK